MNAWTEPETDTDTLKRIATMLLALAVLADRACFARGPVRWFVLLLLRPAAATAQTIVADVTRLADSLPDSDVLRRADGIAEAMSLAHEFRLLAAALYEYLLWAALRASQWDADERAYNANIRSVGSTQDRSSVKSVLPPARAWRLRIDDS